MKKEEFEKKMDLIGSRNIKTRGFRGVVRG